MDILVGLAILGLCFWVLIEHENNMPAENRLEEKVVGVGFSGCMTFAFLLICAAGVLVLIGG